MMYLHFFLRNNIPINLKPFDSDGKIFYRTTLIKLHMMSVEIDRPEILEKIREKLRSKLGKKFSDQELLEKCLTFSSKHLEELINELISDEGGFWESRSLNISKYDKKPLLLESLSGILEEEYSRVKESGKRVKDLTGESWRY